VVFVFLYNTTPYSCDYLVTMNYQGGALCTLDPRRLAAIHVPLFTRRKTHAYNNTVIYCHTIEIYKHTNCLVL